MVGRTNTGGGGSGATLIIMGVAGATVTASKNGKTYTRTINNSGTAVFKGLSTGTWTVTMSGDGQTATRTVEITADYSLTIAYFSATINITYPATSTCVVTNSSGQTVESDTNTTSSEKTFIATVNDTGTYTVTATATDGSGKIKSQSVEITSEGQSVSVTLNYQLVLFDGGAVEPWTVIGANPTATISDTIYLYAANPETPVVSSVRTTNKIDMSGYSTLKYTVTENKTPSLSFMCVTSSTDAPITAGYTNTVTSDVVAYGQPSNTGTYEVKVSEIQGSYYVSLAVGWYGQSGFGISKVWLE